MTKNDFFPFKLDYERMNKLGFINGDNLTDKFEAVYKIYSLFLLKYIDEKLGLTKIENDIDNSVLDIKEVEESEKDIYQSLSYLKYFYVRNTLFIERLSESIINELYERYINNQLYYDKYAEDIINITIRTVIIGDNDHTFSNFGPVSSGDYYAPLDCIIIGERFDPEYHKGNSKDGSWMSEFMQKDMLFSVIKGMIEQESKMEIPIFVIKYDENSIKKKTVENNSFNISK